MPRLHLFEFEDQPWFPQVIREGMMDYLRHMINWFELYKPAAAIMKKTLDQSGENQIIELCAGSGGGVSKMKKYLVELNCDAKIFLTDLFPNLETYKVLKQQTGGEIDFISQPVNAMNVSGELRGMRTMFSALHHFKPEQVKAMLQDVADKKTAVTIFDASSNVLGILGVLLIQPLTFVLLTPFFKPFRWSRIFFTYIIPLIPLFTLWDGSISVLRFYSEKELRKIISEIETEDYQWNVGHFRNKIGLRVNYVTGVPK